MYFYLRENIIFIKNRKFFFTRRLSFKWNFWTFRYARLAIEIHLRGKLVEVHSQETDYGGTNLLYPEEFFGLGASTDSKNKTSAWLVHWFHTGIFGRADLLQHSVIKNFQLAAWVFNIFSVRCYGSARRKVFITLLTTQKHFLNAWKSKFIICS